MPAATLPARSRAWSALLVLFVAVALLGVSAVGKARPAAASTGPIATHVHASARVIDYARHGDLRIHVYDSAGHALGGVHVNVWKLRSTGLVKVASLTTGATSHVADYRPWLKSTTSYYVGVPSSAAYQHSDDWQRIQVRSFGASLVQVGSTKEGAPYQWGADGPWRFDCSGFTRWVAEHYGKSLPHSSSSQYSIVRHIAKSDKRIGDLVFVHDSSGNVYHVGFYAGNGRLLAATHSGDYVRVESLWTSSYYVGRLSP